MGQQSLETIHRDIMQGKRSAPPKWTPLGMRYNKYLQEHQDAFEEDYSNDEQSLLYPPVRGENQLRPRPSGYARRDGGYAAVHSGPQEWQTTTNLGCGFNLNVVGAPAPVIGTPLGRHEITGAEVACDPMAWFREGIIANPSAFVLSLPGLGKSTLIRKMLMGGVAAGITPIMAGDIKGEYRGFVEQVGGQVITIGHGIGSINPLDVGALGRVIPQLEGAVAEASQRLQAAKTSGTYDEIEQADIDLSTKRALLDRAREQVHGRQVTMVSTLVGLGRGTPIEDYESGLVSRALRELYQRSDHIDWHLPPELPELIELLQEGSPELFDKGRARNKQEWDARIDHLVLSLNSLLDGVTGRIFSGQTSTPIELESTAVCIDVSEIDRGDTAMKAAVMMACWANAFGAIEAAHTLADAGLTPQRYFAVTLDELWQVLAAAPGMVNQIDALTRLNRTDATALYMITHTFKDLQALPTEQDRMTAMGFIERAGMVICGGLPNSELDILSNQLSFSPAEGQLITSWSKGASPKRARTRGAQSAPPGRGRFMIKPSKDGAPGIPVQTVLFPSEIQYRLHDTNARFKDFFAAGNQ